MAEHFSLHESDRLLDNLIDVDAGELRLGISGELANPRYNLARPFGVADDPSHAGDRLFRLRYFASKPTQAGFAVGSDGAERLTDLMGNRRTHRTEHCHARNVGDLRLRLLQCLMFELQRLIEVLQFEDGGLQVVPCAPEGVGRRPRGSAEPSA